LNKLAIIFPSYKRAEWLIKNDRLFLKTCFRLYHEHTYLVIRRSQHKAYSTLIKTYNIKLLFVPDKVNGISETRQLILKNKYLNKYYENILMLDDDTFLFNRCLKTKLRDKLLHQFCADHLFNNFIEHVEKLTCYEVPIGSFIPQNYAGMKPWINYNTRCVYALQVNLKWFNDHNNIAFNEPGFENAEDFYVTLCVLYSGYRSIVSGCYIIQNPPIISGGCNTYRNNESYNETSKNLAKRFPEVVSLVWNNSKTHGKRLKTRINWKKAFKIGQQNRFGDNWENPDVSIYHENEVHMKLKDEYVQKIRETYNGVN
jgi:hypothetical protein